jgi:hypothetical protein
MMDANAKVLYQKVFILATGSAASKDALEIFDSLVTPEVGYGKIAEIVEAYMDGVVRSIGRVEAFRAMLKQGFSVQLTQDAASGLLDALDGAGFNTWTHLYVAALNLGAPYKSALDQKASLANEIADSLESGGKTPFYQGPAVYAATKTVLESVASGAASLELARSNANSFVDALSANGIRSAVVDGYIAGATVLADGDGDGVLDPGEWQGTSDAKGYFSLPSGTVASKLTASGGTDLLTNKAFTGVLSAPSGSTVVNPITTLVQGIVESGSQTTTIDQALVLVNQAMGIPAGINPLSYDPLAVIAKADATPAEKAAALSVQSSAIQVSNTISQLSSVLIAPNAGVSKLDAAAAVTQAITGAIVQASTSPSSEAIDLGSTQFLSAVLTTSIAETSATLSASQIGQIVQVASASNAIADKASSITDLAKAASAAQDATTALVTAAASGNFTSVVSDFTGSALEAKQAAATVGEIAPGVVVPVPPPPPPPPPPVIGGGGIVLPPPVPTTFTVTATGADTLVFDGNATGPIQVVLASAAADGSVTATFTRGGVSTSADISGKAMLVPSDSAIFDLVGTVGSDTLRFKLTETSSELTLSGNLSEGADRIVVVVPDLEDNALDIKLIASDGVLLDGLDDELIIAFSAGDDSFSLRQGSELLGFEALQIRGGQLADVSNASFDPFPQISFVGLSDGGFGI